MNAPTKLLRIGLMLSALHGAGCAIQEVQPWEREFLALPEMSFDGGLVEEASVRDHTFVSKEASSGGAALGGGGCGCN